MAIDQSDLVQYLDEYLAIREIEDYPNALNGLQVESDRPVRKLTVAVDACEATIDLAVSQGADFMMVHHGLFWAGLEPIAGRHWRRVRKLIENGVALYSAHLPLDVHHEVGNNMVLATMLGMEPTGWFGEAGGRPIGVHGTLEMSLDEFVQRVTDRLGVAPQVIAKGPARVSRLGIITGSGGDSIRDARDAGVDTFLTGEGPHHSYFDAEEWGLNVIYAGHYATETVGVKALGARLALKFGVSWKFADHPTGM